MKRGKKPSYQDRCALVEELRKVEYLLIACETVIQQTRAVNQKDYWSLSDFEVLRRLSLLGDLQDLRTGKRKYL